MHWNGQLSTARCPKIDLTECELDALRFLGGRDETTCGVCNRALDTLASYQRNAHSRATYQITWWHNTDMEGKEHEDRACCESGGDVPSESCPTSKLSGGAIIGIVAAGVIILCACLLILENKVRQEKSKTPNTQTGTRYSKATHIVAKV
ncbi:hypothetical protein ACHAXR_006046 [Thalassiosira sp. AJA248-18]